MLFRIFKNCLWCSRLAYKSLMNEHPPVPANKLPWLWIGAELADGKILDMTDTVNKHVRMGDFVDLEYLETQTGYANATWLYLDPATIKQEKYPAKGFVIA